MNKILEALQSLSLGKRFNLWDDLIYHFRIICSGIVNWIPLRPLRRMMENWALYQPIGMPDISRLPRALQASGVEEVFFETEEGHRLHGWYFAGDPNKPTTVFAHGNYGNLYHRRDMLQAFVQNNWGVLMLSYRGYGKSQGKPSEQGLFRDFIAASAFLETEKNISISRQIAMGESLGGSVALEGALRLPFQALVVLCTFTSLKDVYLVLQQKFPILKWLLVSGDVIEQQFSSIDKIQHLRCPILVVQGDQDLIVTLEMSERLLARTTQVPFSKHLVIPGGDHDNLFAIAATPIMAELGEVFTRCHLSAARP